METRPEGINAKQLGAHAKAKLQTKGFSKEGAEKVAQGKSPDSTLDRLKVQKNTKENPSESGDPHNVANEIGKVMEPLGKSDALKGILGGL